MKERCLDPTDAAYANYGGRGILICDSWKNSFAEFLSDMGVKPEGMSLDRIDVNGNYEPGNCRWATAKMQSRNMRKNIVLTLDGVSRCIADWAELLHLPYNTIRNRKVLLGWSDEDALTRPVEQHRKVKK